MDSVIEVLDEGITIAEPVSSLPICDYEDSDYQAKFWGGGQRAYEDQVEAVALKRLLPPTGRHLLEIGAGAGRNTPRYQGFGRVVLLDYSLSQMRLAQERLGRSGRYIYVVGDAYGLPFLPGIFDTATMIRTLHHMIAPGKAIQQVRHVLKAGGVFILEYANKKNLKAILRYVWNGQMRRRGEEWNPFNLKPLEFAELNFDFHPKAVRTWLEENDLIVERQLTVSHFRLGILKKLIPLSLLVGMDSVAQLTGDFWQLSPSVFLRARAEGDSLITTGDGLFRCPDCNSPNLQEGGGGLTCGGCHRCWPIEDGIYIFK